MSLQLRAEQSNVVNMFGSEVRFEIPDFQRPYSWEYNQCFQLYSDLFEMYHLNEEFFLGSIITAKSKEDLETLQVVDGQQRITTLLLWIKALELLYKEKFNSIHGGLDKALYKEDWESSKKVTRLESKIFETKDNDSLQKILNGEFDIEEILSKCIKDNKIDEKKCKNKFERNFIYFYYWTKNDFKNDLKEFITYLLKRVMLLPIELEANTTNEAISRALRIFETINNRGMDLEDSDIFKSKLHILASKIGEKDLFIKRWIELRELSENLGLKIDDIFRYYSHIIRGREKIVSSEINLREFFTLKPYSPFKNSEYNYNKILDELYRIVEIYIYIDDVIESDSELSKWFKLINIYTNQYPKIALMVYLYKIIQDGTSLQELQNTNYSIKIVKFCKSIIRYVYYYGATTTIKSEIYTIIRDVIWDEKISSYYRDTAISDFDHLGRLKNGYALLAYYLQFDKSVVMPNIDRVITYKDEMGYMETFANVPIKNKGINIQKINDVYDRLGNFYIIESKKRINKRYLEKLSKYNSESNIFSKQIDMDSYAIIEKPIDVILTRDKKLKKLIVDFMRKPS